MFFLSVCENPGVLKIIAFVLKMLDLVFFIVPIGLIVMISLDFTKSVIASRDDDFRKNLNLVIKRLIFTVVLFLVPTLVEFMITIVDDAQNTLSGEYNSCLENIENIQHFQAIYDWEKRREEEAWQKYLEEENANTNFNNNVINYVVIDKETESGGGGSFVGQKYYFTDDQIKALAAKCIQEQGTDIEGIKAEASIMANLYEYLGTYKGSGEEGLYSYVSTGGWFGGYSKWSSAQNDHLGEVTNEIFDAVKHVFEVERTLPLWIDEHDCWFCNTKNYCGNGNMGDICTITNNGSSYSDKSTITDRDKYDSDKTVINNVYGATYTFYSFEGSNSDPFGYTEASYNRFKN